MKIARRLTFLALLLAVLLVSSHARLDAASSRPIEALDDGAPAVSTDYLEISREVFTGRHRSFRLDVGDLIARTGQEYQLGFGSAKAGATAGWTVAAGANLYEWTLAAGNTASTLVVPVNGLKVGWTITRFKVECQVESAGNTATLDANLRKLTNAAADPADASVATITQVSATADTKVESQSGVISDTVAADERFYLLLTGTTAASTDIRCLGATVTVTEA